MPPRFPGPVRVLLVCSVLATLGTAQDTGGGDAESPFEAAMIVLSSGRVEEAIRLLEQVRPGEPGRELATSYLVLLRLSLSEMSLVEERRAAFSNARSARAASGNTSPIVPRDGHGGDQSVGVRFSPDDGTLLTWSPDGDALLWNPSTGENVGSLGNYTGWTMSAEFGPRGERALVLDSGTRELQLWDPERQQRLAVLGGGGWYYRLFDFRPNDGRVFASSDELGRVRFWESAGGRLLPGAPRIQTPRPWELDFDASGERLLTNGEGGRARVWSARTGELLFDQGGHQDRVCARWCGAGSRLVLHRGYGAPSRGTTNVYASDSLVSGRAVDNRGGQKLVGLSVEVWDLEGEPRLLLERPTLVRPSPAPELRRCFDGSGKRVLTCTEEFGSALFELWDVDSGEALQGWELESRDNVEAVVARDGSRAAILSSDTPGGDYQLQLLSTNTGRVIHESDGRKYVGILSLSSMGSLAVCRGSARGRIEVLEGGDIWSVDDYNSVQAASFSRDGRFLASVSRHARVTSGQGSILLASHVHWPSALVLGPVPDPATGREIVLTGARGAPGLSGGGTLRRWDPRTGEDLGPIGMPGGPDPVSVDTIRSLSAEPGSNRLVIGGNGLYLCEEGGFGLLHQLGEVSYLGAELSNGGESLLATRGGSNPEARLGPPGVLSREGTWESAESTRTFPSYVPPLRGNWYSPVAVHHPDGSRFAMAARAGTGGLSGKIEIRSSPGGELLRTLPGGASPRQLTFSPNGRLLLVAAGTSTLWDIETGERLALHSDLGHGWKGAFDSASRRYALCGQTGALVGSLDDSDHVLLVGHVGDVQHVAFHPDDRRVLTCGRDGTARLWDAESGEELRVFHGHTARIRTALFVLGGERLITASDDSTFRLWDVETGRLLQTRACYAGDNWLAYTPGGWFDGTQQATEWARVVVDGRQYPLSSYAQALRAPHHVAAAARGETVPYAPPLDSAPEVEVLAPERNILGDASFELEVRAEDVHELMAIHVWQDGRPLAHERLELRTRRSRRGTWSATLSVPLVFPATGETTIRVRAENDRGVLSWPETVNLRYEPPAADLYLVAIGVEEYDDPKLNALQFPIDDVEAIVERFEREKGKLFREVHVKTLTDRDVQTVNLRSVLREELMKASELDTTVVFAAGHGARDSLGDYYFLTSETQIDRPEGGISRADLEALVMHPRLASKRRLLLLDTCHAGEEFEPGIRGVGLDDAFTTEEIETAWGSGLYIVAASTEGGLAEERNGHGLFTTALLQALDSDDNDDGRVDVWELIEFTHTMVQDLSQRRQHITRTQSRSGRPFPLSTNSN